MIRGSAKKTKHFSFEFSFQFFSKDKRASAPKKNRTPRAQHWCPRQRLKKGKREEMIHVGVFRSEAESARLLRGERDGDYATVESSITEDGAKSQRRGVVQAQRRGATRGDRERALRGLFERRVVRRAEYPRVRDGSCVPSTTLTRSTCCSRSLDHRPIRLNHDEVHHAACVRTL